MLTSLGRQRPIWGAHSRNSTPRKSFLTINDSGATRWAILLFLLSEGLILAQSAGLSNSSQQQQGLSIKTTEENGSSDQTTTTNQESVDDLLKDTIRLLDTIDQKLVEVDSKTPGGASSAGKPDGAKGGQQHSLAAATTTTTITTTPSLAGKRNSSAQLASPADEGAAIEEALVRLADEFTASRRPSESDDLAAESMAAAASNSSPMTRSEQLVRDQSKTNSATAAIADDGELLDIPKVGTSSAHVKRTRQLHQSAAIAASDDSNQLASDSTERHIKFTLDLMQSIFSSQSYSSKTNLIESFLISPLSIQMVLMLMHLGARGQTRREISNCLHLTTTQPATHSSLDKVLQQAASYQNLNYNNNHNLHQQQRQHGNSQYAADSAGGPGDAAGGASKLKRRHHYNQQNPQQQQQQQQHSQQTSTSEKQQQSSAAASNIAKSQQSTSSRHSPTGIGGGAVSSNTAANTHELFGAAMRNLLKDPIVMKALTSANQIFLQKNLPLSREYEWAIKHYYAADVKLVDFQHQSSAGGGSGDSASLSSLSQSNVAANPQTSAAASSSPAALTFADKGSSLTGTQNGDHHTLSQQQGANFTLSELRQSGVANNGEQANNIQQMVNDWVERQSKGRITDFLASPVSTSTLMMAINVLYFKGDWQYKFDPFDTQTEAMFTQANGKQTKIPMMVNRLPLAFAHDPNMKTSVIELPYKAQRLGLFLLLPDEVSGIFHTMQMLNSSSFANLISSMRKPSPTADQAASGINVRIPKFSIDSSPRLSQILSQQLGLKTLFTPDLADLSGMFVPIKRSSQNSSNNMTQGSGQHKLSSIDNGDNSNGVQPLQVGLDELLHKAVLQVDEQGSVAAASSATILERVGVSNSNYFEADHPFLLFLMDKQTGLVLFSGVFAGSNNNTTNNSNQEAQQKQL